MNKYSCDLSLRRGIRLHERVQLYVRLRERLIATISRFLHLRYRVGFICANLLNNIALSNSNNIYLMRIFKIFINSANLFLNKD